MRVTGVSGMTETQEQQWWSNAFGLKEECWGHFNQKKKVNSKKDKAAKHAKEMAAAALKQQASGRESDARTKPKTLQKD